MTSYPQPVVDGDAEFDHLSNEELDEFIDRVEAESDEMYDELVKNKNELNEKEIEDLRQKLEELGKIETIYEENFVEDEDQMEETVDAELEEDNEESDEHDSEVDHE